MTGLKDFEIVSIHPQIITLQDLLCGRMSGWCSVSRQLLSGNKVRYQPT